MKKFHIGKNGPAKCSATIKDCPLGGAGVTVEHYDTKEEAQTAWEAQLAAEHGAHNTINNTNGMAAEALSELFKNTPNFSKDFFGRELKRGEYLSTTNFVSIQDSAKKVREDLKKAIKKGFLPKDIKYTISANNRYKEIRLTVNNMPSDPEVYDYHTGHAAIKDSVIMKPEYRELEDRLLKIVNSHNYGDSTYGGSGSFDFGYFGEVRLPKDHESANLEIIKKEAKIKRTISSLKKQGLTVEEIKTSPSYQAAYNEYLESGRKFSTAATFNEKLTKRLRENDQIDTEEIRDESKRHSDMMFKMFAARAKKKFL